MSGGAKPSVITPLKAFVSAARVMPGLIFWHSVRMAAIFFERSWSASVPARDGMATKPRMVTTSKIPMNVFIMCVLLPNVES